MDTNPTLELGTPVRRHTWIAGAAVVLALIAVAGHQFVSAAGLRGELAGASADQRACEQQRKELSAEVDSLKAKLAAPSPAFDPSLLALRDGEATDEGATTEKKASGRKATAGQSPTQEEVLGLIRDGQPRLQSCYQRALRRDPDLGLRPLRLNLSFKVRSAGRISRVAFEPSPGRRLSACLRGVVRDWKVKPFSGAAIAVEVPITLTPKS